VWFGLERLPNCESGWQSVHFQISSYREERKKINLTYLFLEFGVFLLCVYEVENDVERTRKDE